MAPFKNVVTTQADWQQGTLDGVVATAAGDLELRYTGDYRYRIPITVTNNETVEKTDVPVLVSFDTASLIASGKMRADGGDIRFAPQDSFNSADWTTYSYWLWDGLNTAATRIYVKVPFIPASGSVSFYLYFGNSEATSQSNGSQVFTYFDGIEDGDVSNFSTDEISVSADSTEVYTGSFSVRHDAEGPNWDDLVLSLVNNLDGVAHDWRGHLLEFEYKGWASDGVYPFDYAVDPINSAGQRMNSWRRIGMRDFWQTFSDDLDTNTYAADITRILFFTTNDNINRKIWMDNIRVRKKASVSVVLGQIQQITDFGTRTSPPLNLSTIGTAAGSSISWVATTPAGTSITVETRLSLDGGQTWGPWQACTNGGAIPGITPGMDLSNAQIQTRVTLSTANIMVTPQLHDLTLSIGSQVTDLSPTSFEVGISRQMLAAMDITADVSGVIRTAPTSVKVGVARSLAHPMLVKVVVSQSTLFPLDIEIQVSRDRQIHVSLHVGRPDGVTWADVSDYLVSATVELGDISGVGTGQSGVDGVVRRANFVLRNDRASIPGNSFSPRDRQSAWNQFDVDGDGALEYAPLLWPNREVVLKVAVTLPSAEPGPFDWVTIFHGLLGDAIRTSGSTVTCDARDLAKRLQDTYILTPREYGSEAGTPAEDVIQQIIDDNLGPGEVTLYFPSGTASDPRPIAESPGFMVTPYVVEYMSVWDAIQQVAAQFGWFLGYRWHPNTGRMQLILMEPPRNKDASTADFYFSWEDDIYTQDLEITDRDIRNIVTVTFRNSATGDRESVTVKDDTSIATYGPRAMQIEEGDASLIDTPEEAERLANAALADLKDLTATTQLQMPLLPTLDVFSGIVITDPRLSSTDDFFGVEQVRHVLNFEARQFRTEAVAAGRVIGGHHRWLRMQTRPGQAAPPSPERVVGGGRVMPKPTGLVARGILRGVALDVPVPPVNVNRWAATEVHLSEVQGFTPSDATRVASGRETHFEIMSGLVAGTTYYLRAFYVDVKGNKSPVSDEVSAVAGMITELDIDGALFSITPSSTPDPSSGNLEDLWDMDTSTGVTFPSAPITITFRYPVYQGSDVLEIHLQSAARGYVQMRQRDTDLWIDVLGSPSSPVSFVAGWNRQRFSGNKLYFGREYRLVLLDNVRINELRFERVTVADLILAGRLRLTGDMAVETPDGRVRIDVSGVWGYDAQGNRQAGFSTDGKWIAGDGAIEADKDGLRAKRGNEITFNLNTEGDAWFGGDVQARTFILPVRPA